MWLPDVVRSAPVLLLACSVPFVRRSLGNITTADFNTAVFQDDKIEADLFATTGDYLRIWKIGEQGFTSMECLLNNVSRFASVFRRV